MRWWLPTRERLLCRESEDHIHEGEYNCEYECNPESTDSESRNNLGYEEYHEHIDNEGDESECEDIERESEGIEYRYDSYIDYSEYDRDDEGGQISIDRYARDEIWGYSDCECWEEETYESIHGKVMLEG